MDGLGEGRRRHHVGDTDERDLHCDLLDEKREPAGGVQQAAYVVSVRLEVDGMSACGLHPVQEQVDGRTGERLVVAGDDEGRDAHDALGRLPGHRHGGDGQARVGGRGHDLLERRPEQAGIQVEAVDHEEGVDAVHGPAQRTLGGVAGRRGYVEGVQACREDVLGAQHPARVDPGAVAPGGRVAREQGLPAAGGTDDADPARGRQRSGEASLGLLATETWGEHGANLSVERHRLGRTTDAATPGDART